MKGMFIALEGIDGCGKTSQVQALAEWLPTSGLMPQESQLIVTREPGGTAFGQTLRSLLLNPPDDQAPVDRAELLLYMADRAQHVEIVIKPALEAGHWVLSDRFTASTVAYQGFGRGLSLDTVLFLNYFVTGGLQPSPMFWIDIPVDEALKRTQDKQPDRIEAEGRVFLERVRGGFEQIHLSHMRDELEMDTFKIDGTKSPESVTEACKSIIHFFATGEFKNRNY